jgi:hypothetical protein
MIASLKLVYVVLGSVPLTTFLFKVLTSPSSDRNPNPMGFVWCTLLFTATPSLGYLLLFKAVPAVVRIARR